MKSKRLLIAMSLILLPMLAIIKPVFVGAVVIGLIMLALYKGVKEDIKRDVRNTYGEKL